jgi:hypothetical protein
VLARAAEVEIAVAEARFFGGVDFVFDLKGRGFRVVEDVQPGGDDFNFAGGKVGVRFLTLDDFAFDGNDVFTADVFGFGVSLELHFLVENNLDDAGAVADVEEQEVAEVAALGYPA